MTLAVAQLMGSPASGITMVADTKITKFTDERWTRHVYENALPKLVIVRPDLCIAIAGSDPDGSVRRAVECASLSVDSAVEMLESDVAGRAFLVAGLDGGDVRLVRVGVDGRRDASESGGRAWVGDYRAYERFQERCSDFADESPGIAMWSALGFVTDMSPDLETVGGFITRVALTPSGFRYVADYRWIGPEEAAFSIPVDRRTGAQQIQLHWAGRDHISMQCLAGTPPTIGAVGYYMAELRFGLLFAHLAPWQRQTIRAETVEAFRERAADFGQHLSRPPPIPSWPG